MGKDKEIPINTEEEETAETPTEEAVAGELNATGTDTEIATESEVEAAEETEADEELSEEEKLKQQLAQAEEKLLLTLADFENYRKRQARRQQEFYKTCNDNLLASLLDVVDNFERALAHADQAADNNGLAEGTKLILNQLRDILDRYEVRPIEAVGQPFDPAYHEAMMQVDSDEYDEGIIALEMAKGYRIADRVLRHSRVGVSKGPAQPEDEDQQAE
jgi:molecular chaperone GrpE